MLPEIVTKIMNSSVGVEITVSESLKCVLSEHKVYFTLSVIRREIAPPTQ